MSGETIPERGGGVKGESSVNICVGLDGKKIEHREHGGKRRTQSKKETKKERASNGGEKI
jgi:hypothetical protein